MIVSNKFLLLPVAFAYAMKLSGYLTIISENKYVKKFMLLEKLSAGKIIYIALVNKINILLIETNQQNDEA